MILDHVIKQTEAYLECMPKVSRKKIGQFFTSRETAEYMASMVDVDSLPDQVWVLDPGAGTGILSAALIERLQTCEHIHEIHLTCYENDPSVLPVLSDTLLTIEKQCTKKIHCELLAYDYILSQIDDFQASPMAHIKPQKYHVVIANPPYLRILRDHPAALSMQTVVHGAPNMYFLFATMSLFNLEKHGEMIYIIPRSWTSGAYFTAFRQYLFESSHIEQIHLFISRNEVFDSESVLQETMIVKVRKSAYQPETVLVTSSRSNRDFADITKILVPYSTVVSGTDMYVYLPTSENDIDTINQINRYAQTLPEIGLRMKTGIVVDFRQREELRTEPGEHIVPLFYAQHIRNGRVHHEPSGKEADWIVDEKPGLIQENKDYVFCKRFSAKEEKRRIQCGIYLAEDFPEYEKIATQNKINYVASTDGSELSREMIYGIYALLNSTLFDQYYRILNGSTQINSTEINSIPVPPREKIQTIGSILMESGDLSTEACDKALKEVAYD